MEKFQKLMASKKAKQVSGDEQKAKLDVLKDLKKQAMEMMGEKVSGLKKVTIASDSKEGLKKGLEKAEEVVDKSPEEQEACPECEGHGCEACESEEHEASESPEQESSEESEEELDKKIKELMAKKEALKSKAY